MKLRPHHLLCLLTFAGEGYTPEFTANFAAIVARIGAGEPIELVDGPDDVCAPLAETDDQHCASPSIRQRDRIALLEIGADAVPATRPFVLDAAAIAALRERFAAGAIRSACVRCEWADLCTKIARAGFAGAVA